jgi:hypothetical protein
MTLKCTVDGRPEAADHVISVCHHCGRPVCEQHGWVVSVDEAFDDSAEDSGRREPQDAARTAKRVPQPAMHCKQCVDKDHPRAQKHPRWADPREAQRAAQARAAAQAAQPPQQQPAPQPGQAWGQLGQQQWQQPPGQQNSGQQFDRATGRP